MIATTMYESQETAESLIQDIQDPGFYHGEKSGISALKSQSWPSFNDWKKIDNHEVNFGVRNNKIREKVTSITELKRIANLETSEPRE